jgi:hypothetical protein
MNPWSEENFLERLTPQLRRENHAQMGSCPDSETLVAFTEGQVPPFLRDAVTAHLRQCRECSEAYARLVNFAQETVPEQDSEWVNAEKRLKNWIDPFLLSRAANSKTPTGGVHVLRGNDAPKASWWRLLPAVGIAAVFLVVAGVFFARHGRLSSTAVQVVTRQAPPPIVNSAPAPTVNTPEYERESATPANPTRKTSSQIRKNSAPIVRKSTEPGIDSRHHSSQPEISQPENLQPPPSPANIPNRDQSSVTAQGRVPPGQSSNDRILSIPESASLIPSGPEAAAPAAEHASRPALSAKAGTRITKPAGHPERFRFQAGTQLWIRVVAINRQSDGRFEFGGTLLQPVSDAGGALLDQGAEVTGSGSVKETVTTVSVRGFIAGGVHYVLPAGTGISNEQSPGTGKAVQFSKGQILQMWVSSETVYEKAAGDANSLDPDKP